MKKYIFKRFLATFPLLLGMSFVSFFFIRLAPGDMLAPYRANPQVSQETIAAIEKKFHLDKPLFEQYGYWLRNILHGDMGYSFLKKDNVSSVILSRLANTLILALFTIFITWTVAIPLGIYSAANQYKPVDGFFSFISYIGISFPNFFLALLLLALISVTPEIPIVGKLPLGGMKSPDYETFSTVQKFFDVLKHLLVPGIVLATASMAGLQRIMRGNMLEELRQRYITTARAKGLPENKVIYKHALRNAINPLITIFGYEFSTLLSGAALTEIITGYPGLGAVMLEAVRAQDQFLVMGDMLMSGILLIAGNLIADILLAVCDPRVKLS
ncbi:MAG: ABC transporter permease [Chitinispirillales bacterium]|jgi:peptide/nickel transport system permease protein|nr:ABC transporter permease [Chitinispirillales bacterium]